MDIQTKYRRTKIFHKFFRVSFAQLARLINDAQEAKRTGLQTDRVVVYQVVAGIMKTLWIRRAIAEVLGEPVEELWPGRDDKRGPYKPRKAA